MNISDLIANLMESLQQAQREADQRSRDVTSELNTLLNSVTSDALPETADRLIVLAAQRNTPDPVFRTEVLSLLQGTIDAINA